MILDCTVDNAIKILNEAQEADRVAFSQLCLKRVECNEQLGQHETIQTGLLESGCFEVGLIGVINGLFGVDDNGSGVIAAIVDDGGIIQKFRRR